MASAKAEEGLPAPGEGEKVNGDSDLDFTITMNESEDEASGDDAPASKLVQKANGTPSLAKVNGKMTSDEDSQSSLSKKAKTDNDDGDEKDEEDDSASKGEPEDETPDNDNAEEHEAEKESSEEEKGEDKEKLDLNTSGKEDSGKEDEACAEEPDEAEEKKEESRDSHKDSPDEKDDKMDTSEHKDDEDDDDDVVEIEDSPIKQPAGKVLAGGGGFKGGRDSAGASFVKVSNSSVSGANFVSYLGAVPGASLLTSTAGMQLVQVQGAGLVYVPTNSAAAQSAAAVGGMNKGLSHQNASLLFPQYANMMTGNQNRLMMPPFSQGVRPGMPATPILTNIPDKPTSSLGMIENIRWEVENHINIKPKYAKPNPKAELGHLTKWSFDLGSDLVKEFVYHDLVRIQTYRNNEGSLSSKEKDDFAKLQEIDKELNHKIGHLKIRLNKHCRCGFRTELSNVLYNHQQHAHIERGGFFGCILCKYSTRQPSTFKFHMESVHGRAGFVESRPTFFECPLCPYDTNYQNRLDQHKVRCLRQYREAFNLHPSCLSGPEVNLCLENVFYYVFTRQFMNSIMPKQQQATAALLSSTKIRDMPGNEASRMKTQTARGMANAQAATMVSSARQIVSKNAAQTFQAGPASMKQQQQQAHGSLSRNFPVMSSKINTTANQPGTSSFTPGRPQGPPNQNQSPASGQPNNGFEVCEICGGYVKDRKALRIHFYYAHRIDMPFGVFERPQAPLYCATCFARFWTAQGLQKHIEVHKNDMMQGASQPSNGVAGKCISCGHRVPNILMHMRMVHNRELRHYLAAVMCIFCGNRFSTKKEVEAHMGKMHGVIVKNSSVQGGGGLDRPQAIPQGASRAGVQQPKPNVPAQRTPADASSSSKAGPKTSKMNRSSQCVLCNLSFSRNVDLTRHCMRVHHTCMKCGLVVVDKESLARHTCLHSASGMRTCQICKETGFHPAYYIKHMRDKHLRKCSVVLRHIDRAVVETMKRPITISDSDEDEEEESGDGPSEPKLQKTNPEKKEKTAEGGNGARPGDADEAAEKKDSVCKNETEDNEHKDGAKQEVEKKTEGEVKPDGDNDHVEQKDKPEEDIEANVKENANDTEIGEAGIGGEESENVDSSGSRQAGSEQERAEGSEAAGHQELQDAGASAQEDESSEVDKEDPTDKQDEDSEDRHKLKRKLEENDKDEKDGPSRKSQRRDSQIKEDQD
ncbi:hypothetical protein ACOMHN_058732 [Nucella lapillus]